MLNYIFVQRLRMYLQLRSLVPDSGQGPHNRAGRGGSRGVCTPPLTTDARIQIHCTPMNHHCHCHHCSPITRLRNSSSERALYVTKNLAHFHPSPKIVIFGKLLLHPLLFRFRAPLTLVLRRLLESQQQDGNNYCYPSHQTDRWR